MNKFLIFIILLIFIFEFQKRIKYIYNTDNDDNYANKIKEKFENPLNKFTYMPNEFDSNIDKNINVKDISKDLGVERSINEVISANSDDIPDEFYRPLDVSLFKVRNPIWEVAQRPWIEIPSKEPIEPILIQDDANADYNYQLDDLMKKNKNNFNLFF
jgi:hypothetical protein